MTTERGGDGAASSPAAVVVGDGVKAMILAAGVGSRLSPITAMVPKPLLPVADKPVMEHTLEMLVGAGIKEIKANLHHLPHLVEQHFGNGSRWGARLSYSLESTLLGTAGAVRRVQRFFPDPLVVAVGDSVWDLDLREVIAYHRARAALVTIVVKPMPMSLISRFGVVRVDGEGRVREFQEKPPVEQACSNLTSTGLYVLEPAALDLVPPGEFFDFARDLFPLLLERGLPLYAYRHEGPWSDIGAFPEYLQVHLDLLHGAYRRLRLPAKLTAEGVYQGHHARVHHEAVVRPPVFLGRHCRVGRGAVVGPDAVIGSHSIIAEGARVTRSVVGAHTYVGRGLELEECLAYGNWLVKLPSGAGLYLEDDTLLADARRAGTWRPLGRVVDFTLAALAVAGTLPLFVGLGLVGRLSRQPTIDRRWFLRPEAESRAPAGSTRLRPLPLLQFSPQGRVGMLAERLGVSRLPALFNVMRGDISLVGIKPLTEDEAAQVSDDWLRHLGSVPAGLTGLWQLHGGDRAPLDETLAADAYYAAYRSLWGDLTILWQTALRRGRRFGT
jgi:mannose-1-phosphate guanylyltransferase